MTVTPGGTSWSKATRLWVPTGTRVLATVNPRTGRHASGSPLGRTSSVGVDPSSHWAASTQTLRPVTAPMLSSRGRTYTAPLGIWRAAAYRVQPVPTVTWPLEADAPTVFPVASIAWRTSWLVNGDVARR